MRRWMLLPAVLVALSGCYRSHVFVYEEGHDGGLPQSDAAPLDGSPPHLDAGRDAGPFDAGRIDAGPPRIDAGPPRLDAGRDAGPLDAGPPRIDAGPPRVDAGRDAGPLDAGPPRIDAGLDAGPPRIDAGPFDAGPPRIDAGPPRIDAGPPRVDAGRDAGPFDAGRVDSGPLDAGRLDAGPDRPALRFGAGTFFGVGDAPSFRLPGDSTFELWVRSREAGSVDYCGKGGDTMARDLILGQRDGVFVAGWSVAADAYIAMGTAVPLGAWTHLAMVRRADADGTHRLLFYVDGVLAGSVSGLTHLTDAFNDQELRCGFGDFDLDEVRLWRVARTEADLRASMSRHVSGGLPGLVAYWRLDERGQIVLDYTATGRVGVLGRLTTPDAADPTWITDGPF